MTYYTLMENIIIFDVSEKLGFANILLNKILMFYSVIHINVNLHLTYQDRYTSK